MIILEGPDGSGKTTLANLIKAAFPDFKSLHSPGPLKPEVLKERMFWNKEITKIDYLIADRMTVFTEYVYGETIREGSLVDILDVLAFMKDFEKNPRNIQIFCDREFKPTEESDSQMSEEEQKELDKKVNANIVAIRDSYRDLFSKLINKFYKKNIFVVKTQEDIVYLMQKIQVEYGR